ncbi:hypothetical protein FACS1894116_01800 [Betaproteobacteria bacterium]|nr:hypothetical protein FACS1894116_01800 [Betaproteobacteria bacterium]
MVLLYVLKSDGASYRDSHAGQIARRNRLRRHEVIALALRGCFGVTSGGTPPAAFDFMAVFILRQTVHHETSQQINRDFKRLL